MLTMLLEPLQFPFMVNAMLVATIVAVPCALLSVFLVLKGWALMGDAMSHAVFPGVVVAYIIGIPFAIGAFIAGLFCAVATGFLDDNSRIKRDTIMGIVFSGMFGAGLVLYVAIQSEVHLDHILFGDMLGISTSDIGQTAVIALAIALIIGLKWRDFYCTPLIEPGQSQRPALRAAALWSAVHDRADYRRDVKVGGDYSVDFAADSTRRYRPAADAALCQRIIAGNGNRRGLFAGGRLAVVLSR